MDLTEVYLVLLELERFYKIYYRMLFLGEDQLIELFD